MKTISHWMVLATFAASVGTFAQGCSSDEGAMAGGYGDSGSAGASSKGSSAGGSGQSGAKAGAAGASGAVTASAACTSYCGKVATSCTAQNEQFTSMDTCLGYCADLPLGTKADTSGNTAWCRDYHAGNAAKDPVAHCAHAGPSGAGHCGNNCESFCSVAIKACPTAFASEADCNTQCNAFPGSDITSYNDSDKSGNTFACRMYHLSAAVTQPAPHCGHIGTASPTCTK